MPSVKIKLMNAFEALKKEGKKITNHSKRREKKEFGTWKKKNPKKTSTSRKILNLQENNTVITWCRKRT